MTDHRSALNYRRWTYNLLATPRSMNWILRKFYTMNGKWSPKHWNQNCVIPIRLGTWKQRRLQEAPKTNWLPWLRPCGISVRYMPLDGFFGIWILWNSISAGGGELTTLPQTVLSDGEGDTPHYSSPLRRLRRLVLNVSGTKPIWTPRLLKAGAAPGNNHREINEKISITETESECRIFNFKSNFAVKMVHETPQT